MKKLIDKLNVYISVYIAIFSVIHSNYSHDIIGIKFA